MADDDEPPQDPPQSGGYEQRGKVSPFPPSKPGERKNSREYDPNNLKGIPTKRVEKLMAFRNREIAYQVINLRRRFKTHNAIAADLGIAPGQVGKILAKYEAAAGRVVFQDAKGMVARLCEEAEAVAREAYERIDVMKKGLQESKQDRLESSGGADGKGRVLSRGSIRKFEREYNGYLRTILVSIETRRRLVLGPDAEDDPLVDPEEGMPITKLKSITVQSGKPIDPRVLALLQAEAIDVTPTTATTEPTQEAP